MRPQPSRWQPFYEWTRIFVAPEGPTQVYFNESPLGILRLAINSCSDHSATPPVPIPLPRYPERITMEDYFYTTATLDDVVEITPCRREFNHHSAITGLLIRYSNGNRACVGQFRLDCIGPVLEVGGSQKLHLGFARSHLNAPYLAEAALFPPSRREPYEWLDVPWEGRLEWWFSFWQTKIHHGSQESPSLVNASLAHLYQPRV